MNLQLSLSPEFQPKTSQFSPEVVREMLADLTPTFFNIIDSYEEICTVAQNASDILSRSIDLSDSASVDYDVSLLDGYSAFKRGEMVYEKLAEDYMLRQKLKADVGMKGDAETVIHRGMVGFIPNLGLIPKLKASLPLGPHYFGNNAYFHELDPLQRQYPGHKNFYRLSSTETDKPIVFGSDIKPDDSNEPFKIATVADEVMLVRDLKSFALKPQLV